MKSISWLVAFLVGSCVGAALIFALQNHDTPCFLLALGFAIYVISNFLSDEVLNND